MKEINFDRLVVFRPGLLRCNRRERRYMEMCAIALSNWLDILEWWSVNTADLAQVIVQEAITSHGESIGVCPYIMYEHCDIIRCMKRIKYS